MRTTFPDSKSLFHATALVSGLVSAALFSNAGLSQVPQLDCAPSQAGKPAPVIERGKILDAHGAVLACSLFRRIVVADGRLLADPDLPKSVLPGIVAKAAEVLQLDQHAIEQKVSRDRHYSVIARGVQEEVYVRLTNEIARLDLGFDEKSLTEKQTAAVTRVRQKAFYVDPRPDFVRCHPLGQVAAHVLGYLDGDGRGTDGIERRFEKQLSAGVDVRLALDRVVQMVVEKELAKAMQTCRPTSVVGIVMRPQTGEILAMAVCPSFDPSAPGKTLAAHQNGQEGLRALRNPCIAECAEPGSVFAVVPIAGVLNDGILTLQDTLDPKSPLVFRGLPLHDSSHDGNKTLKDVVVHGGSVGVAKVGIKLGQQRLYDYIRAFGFGQRTGVDLPGEIPGIAHPPSQWSAISLAHIPMDHEVAVTPLQLCAAMGLFGNQGQLMKPLIVDALLGRNGKVMERFAPVKVRQVISPETTSQMVEALVAAVQPGGIGAKAAMDGCEVAGKTGTAQKVQDGRYVTKYYLTFAGFLPARRPQLCICICMDTPSHPEDIYYSGKLVAPIFKAIAERLLKILEIKVSG